MRRSRGLRAAGDFLSFFDSAGPVGSFEEAREAVARSSVSEEKRDEVSGRFGGGNSLEVFHLHDRS